MPTATVTKMGATKMSNTSRLVVLGFLSGAATARAYSPEESPTPQVVAASEIEWKGIFGSRGKDEHQGYVLVAREFMGIPFLSGEPNQC